MTALVIVTAIALLSMVYESWQKRPYRKLLDAIETELCEQGVSGFTKIFVHERGVPLEAVKGITVHAPVNGTIRLLDYYKNDDCKWHLAESCQA